MSSDNTLLFIYAGVFGYRESKAYALEIKEKKPETEIVIVTCDCDAKDKTEELEPLHADGTLFDIVMMDECGGYTSMQAILQSIRSTYNT
jgi:hypothetical protein